MLENAINKSTKERVIVRLLFTYSDPRTQQEFGKFYIIAIVMTSALHKMLIG